MTKGTAEDYWARTAESCFEAMGSTYRPGERADAPMAAQAAPARPVRRSLPPLTASQTIVDAIAACAPSREADAAPPAPAAPVRAGRSRVAAD